MRVQLRRLVLALLLLPALGLPASGAARGEETEPPAPGAVQQPVPTLTGERQLDVDFLFHYYEQDGDRSPVTGGIGSEALDVYAPVIVVNWAVNDDWILSADLGVDNVTSASMGRIDDNVSGASRKENRVFTRLGATRRFGRQTFSFGGGYSKEWDYRSINGAAAWSMEFNQRNTALNLGVRHFADTIDLIDIHGRDAGQDDRTTTDLSVGLTQVLGERTVGYLNLDFTDQSGFLSTPYYEVILAPTAIFPQGEHVAERLPDSRRRQAAGVGINHGFTTWLVQRFFYRYYDDDWGITAHSVEAETHFRLPTETEIWLYPILRWHTQTASDHYGPPRTFTGAEDYFTVDPDLSEFDSTKFGFGTRIFFRRAPSGLLRNLRRLDFRAPSYDRDDGLQAISIAFGIGWSF